MFCSVAVCLLLGIAILTILFLSHSLCLSISLIKHIPFEKLQTFCHGIVYSQGFSSLYLKNITDSVGTVSREIKHSPCIPLEMYLLRFGRGECQVLGYNGGPSLLSGPRERERDRLFHGCASPQCTHVQWTQWMKPWVTDANVWE